MSVCLSAKLSLILKASKASVNVSNVSYITVVHFVGLLKKKSMYSKYRCLLSQNFFVQPVLIRCPKLVYRYSNGPEIFLLEVVVTQLTFTFSESTLETQANTCSKLTVKTTN